jgi:hypothetical protein
MADIAEGLVFKGAAEATVKTILGAHPLPREWRK